MAVRPGASSGASDICDMLTLINFFSHFDMQLAAVRVHGYKSTAVVDLNDITVGAAVPGKNNGSSV